MKKSKSVQFPCDSQLVTSFCDPPKPHFYRRPSDTSESVLNVHEVLSAYVASCRRMKVQPSNKVEKQISTWHTSGHERQEILCLKGEKIRHLHMECLEEIFKRVQFQALDFEYSFLDDDAVVALSDMIEFYDSAYRLNLSFNQNVGPRGWQAVFRMLRKNPFLEHLNLRYTSLNERSVPLLARALRGECSLVSLHLENCSLSGRSLLILVCALKANRTLKELYLAENNLGPNDAAHLYQLITGNSSIQLLDLRNNALQDAGLSHVCDALRSTACKESSVLNTMVVWNNRITGQGMRYMARALMENKCIQTLNLGCNNIGSDGMGILKDSLARNRSLLRLGLQATKLNCQGAIAVAECIADNPTLVRVDLRDNPDIKSAGLLALNLAIKMNTSITTVNLDRTCCQPANSRVQDYSDQFRKIYDEIQEFCERNRLQHEKKENSLASNFAQKSIADSTEIPAGTAVDTSGTEAEIDQIAPSVDKNLLEFDDVFEKSSTQINRPKSLGFIRQESLTCDDPVDDLRERMKNMPPSPPPERVISEEDESASTPPPSPAETPPARPPTTKKRFFVTCVPNPPTPVPLTLTQQPSLNRITTELLDSHVTPPRTNQRPRTEPKVAPLAGRKVAESAEEIDRIVKSVVSDLVTFSSYEVGDFPYTPSVSKSKRKILADFETATNAEKPGLTIPEPVSPVVKNLIEEMVKFCDYELEGKKCKTEIGAKKKDEQVAVVKDEVGKGVESKESDSEIETAVNETVRDLVKNCIQLERDNLRQSVRQKRKKLVSKLKKLNPD